MIFQCTLRTHDFLQSMHAGTLGLWLRTCLCCNPPRTNMQSLYEGKVTVSMKADNPGKVHPHRKKAQQNASVAGNCVC